MGNSTIYFEARKSEPIAEMRRVGRERLDMRKLEVANTELTRQLAEITKLARERSEASDFYRGLVVKIALECWGVTEGADD